MAAEPTSVSDRRIPPPSEPPHSSGTEDTAVKKPSVVWNKPSGDVPTCQVIADVDSWPALSESMKHPSKSAVDSSPVSSSQGHLISNPKKNRNQSQNHSYTNQNHKPSSNHTTTPARHRPKRGGSSGSGPSQNGITHHPRPLHMPRPKPSPVALRNPPPPPVALRNPPPTPPPLPPYPIYERPYGPVPPPMPFLIPPSFNGNNWDRGPVGGFYAQPTPVNNQSFQRPSNPRGNFVGRPSGDGPANNGHVSRRNASHRGSARPSRALAPPPLPFLPMGYDMTSTYVNYPAPPPEYYMRFPPLLPLFVPAMDPALPSLLIKQIDHYFSDDNLAKDSFLRARMDDEGWVDIAFIASFPKVQGMTQNIQWILDSVKDSTVVEVQGNRIRRRNDWRKWIMSVTQPSTGSSSPRRDGTVENMLASSLKSVALENKTNSMDAVSCDGKADSSSNVVHSDAAN